MGLNTLLFIDNFGGIGIIFLILIALLPVILIIWAIIDLIKSDFKDSTNKVIWALVILFFPFIGALLYLILGRNQKVR